MALPDSYDVSDAFSTDTCMIYLRHELYIPGRGAGRVVKTSAITRLLRVVGEVTPVFTQMPDGILTADASGNLFFIPWDAILCIATKTGGVTAELYDPLCGLVDLTITL